MTQFFGLEKIDNKATDGLSGVSNSLAYRIGEVERHFHSNERWYGVAATPSDTHKADQIAAGIVAFEIDAGNAVYGSWVQILGSADTAQKWDLHRLFFTYAERASQIHFVQFSFGASGDAGITAGTYTECVYRSGAAVSREAPLEFQCRRHDAGTLAWARCLALGADTAKLQFCVGMHYYEG